jgi:Spy/CpxP family protein refolding chaperone
MRKMPLSLFASFVFLFFASYTAYAEPCGSFESRRGVDIAGQGMPMMHHGMEMRDGMPGPGRFPGKRLMELGLDEKQQAAIKEIQSSAMKDAIKKKAEIDVARIELMEVLDKDPVDIRAAEAMLRKIESLATDIHLSHIKEMEAIKAKLTPEQKKKFKEPPKKGDPDKKSKKDTESK